MYLPRRHSRRLLLPPGWVALGFLLLLGCQVLLGERRLRLENVLQLTMPIPEEQAQKHGTDLFIYCFCKPLADIKAETRWQNAQFIGNPLGFSANKAALEAAVRASQDDKGHARGVRVYFRQGATYGGLVGLLDMMNRLNQCKYWLDIEHKPTVFYVVNDKAVKTRSYSEKTASSLSYW